MFRRMAVGLGAALALLSSQALAANGAPTSNYQPSAWVGVVGLPPSLSPPVTCALTSATTCGPFYPTAGRDSNVEGYGTFVASYQLERLLPGETVWKPITAAGTQLYQWTGAASESFSESEWGAQYRVRVTSYTSGSLNVRISK